MYNIFSMNMNQPPQSYNRFPYDQEVSAMPAAEQQIVGGHLASRNTGEALMAFSQAQAQTAAGRPGESHVGSFINHDGSFVAIDEATDQQQQGRLRVTRLTPADSDRPASLATREYTIPAQYRHEGVLFNTIGVEDAELPADMRNLKNTFGPMLLIGRTENGGPALIARQPSEWRGEGPQDELVGIEANSAIAMRRNMDHGIGNTLENTTKSNEIAARGSTRETRFGKAVLKAFNSINDEVAREEAAEFREKAFQVMDSNTGAVHRTFQGEHSESVVGQRRKGYKLPAVPSTNPTAAEARNPRNGVREFPEKPAAHVAPETPTPVDPAAEAYVDDMLAQEKANQGKVGRLIGKLMPKGWKDEVEAESREAYRRQYYKNNPRPTS
jgi:hypothetical protein